MSTDNDLDKMIKGLRRVWGDDALDEVDWSEVPGSDAHFAAENRDKPVSVGAPSNACLVCGRSARVSQKFYVHSDKTMSYSNYDCGHMVRDENGTLHVADQYERELAAAKARSE